MCTRSCIAFGERALSAALVNGSDVLEVGSLDVNGSLRPWVESLRPARYIGVDLVEGPGVDQVVDVGRLVHHFGCESFDIVVTTEMLEHVRDWRTAVRNLKGVLRPGGHLLLTTRSPGFPYHAWPYDFWRYEPADIRQIFDDLELLAVEPDPQDPGVFVLARRPQAFVERTPELALVSMITGHRALAVTDREVQLVTIRHQILAPVRGVWRRLPPGIRSTVKRASGRA
jgi:SAM-dependent methyltransferase